MGVMNTMFPSGSSQTHEPKTNMHERGGNQTKHERVWCQVGLTVKFSRKRGQKLLLVVKAKISFKGRTLNKSQDLERIFLGRGKEKHENLHSVKNRGISLLAKKFLKGHSDYSPLQLHSKKYSQSLSFLAVMFYRVTTNPELTNHCSYGEYRARFLEPLITTYSSTNQYKTLSV